MTNEEILAKVLDVNIKSIRLHKSANLRINEAVEAMEIAVADVGKQKELLKAFVDWQKKYKDSSYVDMFNIDTYLEK